MKKVMFVCNSGGHLTEMLKLHNVMVKYEYMLVTEKTVITEKIKNKYNIKFVKYMSRKNIITYLFNGFINIIISIYNIIKFNPKIIISTGACVGAIYCFSGKILGKKIIYIESASRIDTLSGTGKVMYKIADKFYVQWEELEQKYNKSEYIGRLM